MKKLTADNFRHNIFGRVIKARWRGEEQYFYLTSPNGKNYQVLLTPELVLDLTEAAGPSLDDWPGLEVLIYLEAGKLRLQAQPEK